MYLVAHILASIRGTIKEVRGFKVFLLKIRWQPTVDIFEGIPLLLMRGNMNTVDNSSSTPLPTMST